MKELYETNNLKKDHYPTLYAKVEVWVVGATYSQSKQLQMEILLYDITKTQEGYSINIRKAIFHDA